MRIALACFALGLVLMVSDLALWPGVILMFAFIVRGVFVIADPAFLGREDD